MTAKTRITHPEALALALQLIDLLGDATERVAIAGSIRRGAASIGDIEIVAKPRFEGKTNMLIRRMTELRGAETLALRYNKADHPIAWSDRFMATWYKGVAFDLFMVLSDRQWGPTMVIRTGPGEANAAMVTQVGAVNQSFGVEGICPVGMKFDKGAIWDGFGHDMLDTPEEVDVFAALGLPWLPPFKRTPARYQEYAQRRAKLPLVTTARAMMLEWGEVGRHSFMAGYPPIQDAVYVPTGNGQYVARVLQWRAGCGPGPSTEEATQLSMFERQMEYG